MKLTRILPVILILSACTPAAPPPTPTLIPPTETATLAPSATFTIEPTATSTNTPEPTKIPMPEGWTAIAETREIGKRQVVLNEKGEAATEIDGEWYPVDMKGCFYTEFFDPENQTDPGIDVLIQKLNDENSLVLGKKEGEFERNHGVEIVGYGTGGGKYPSYWENESDAILIDQNLCFNPRTKEWEHILDFVLPRNPKTMSEETKIMRAVVGWIRKNEYVSFTYKEKRIFTGHFPDTSGETPQKGDSLKEAFELWHQPINDQEQVGVGMPLNVLSNSTGDMGEYEYKGIVPKLIFKISDTNPKKWSDIVKDLEFLNWALSDRSLMKAWSKSTEFAQQTFVSNREKIWRYMGEQAAINKLLEPTLRCVTVLK